MRKKDKLLEDVRECLTNPIFDVTQNFSLEKSKQYYTIYSKQWEDDQRYKNNPANKREEVVFDYSNLEEMARQSIQAHNLITNLEKESFIRNPHYFVRWETIVVAWDRLKTFDEWLTDGLQDALIQAYKYPENWAKMIIGKELGNGNYSNTAIHLFAEWEIDRKVLERLGKSEWFNPIIDRDIVDDVETLKKYLEGEKPEKEKTADVTVLEIKLN